MPLYRVRINRNNQYPATEHFVVAAGSTDEAISLAMRHIRTDRRITPEEFTKYYSLDAVIQELGNVVFTVEIPR